MKKEIGSFLIVIGVTIMVILGSMLLDSKDQLLPEEQPVSSIFNPTPGPTDFSYFGARD